MPSPVHDPLNPVILPWPQGVTLLLGQVRRLRQHLDLGSAAPELRLLTLIWSLWQTQHEAADCHHSHHGQEPGLGAACAPQHPGTAWPWRSVEQALVAGGSGSRIPKILGP